MDWLIQESFFLELAIKLFWGNPLNTLMILDSKERIASEKFRSQT